MTSYFELLSIYLSGTSMFDCFLTAVIMFPHCCYYVSSLLLLCFLIAVIMRALFFISDHCHEPVVLTVALVLEYILNIAFVK